MAAVTFSGAPIALKGTELKVGDAAPKATIVGKDLNEVVVGGATGKIQVLVSVPSIDTGVCATETRTFNAELASNDTVELTIVSRDLPFALGRFCGAEGIDRVTVASDFRTGEFGRNYGLVIDGCALAGLLARAVYIVDRNGKIAYIQIVPEITTEPDYAAVKAAVAQL